MVSSSVSARFLYGLPYRFQREWTVLCSMKHPLDVVRVGAWNSLITHMSFVSCNKTALYDVVRKWKHFLHNWSFVRSPLDSLTKTPLVSPHKDPVMRKLDVLFVIGLNELLNTQSSYWWCEPRHNAHVTSSKWIFYRYLSSSQLYMTYR